MTLDDLAALIAARAEADPETSWTAKLLAKGPEKCAEKFGEEAVEAIIEAVKGDSKALTSEAADVLFHLLVMLQSRGVDVVMNRCPKIEYQRLFGELRMGGFATGVISSKL